MAEPAKPDADRCWWCGGPADSREHKFKRTDIDREFGGGPYLEGQTLVRHRIGGRPSDVTGSKSKVFKFERTMCTRCNGERSQPFDTAYDEFMEYLSAHENTLLRSGEVDLREVFGPEWEEKGLDLARYFAKHICCRLTDGPEPIGVDPRLIEFLDGGSYPRCLGLALLIDMSVAEWWRAMRLFEQSPGDLGSFLYMPGIAVVKREDGGFEKPEAGMLVGWFGIYWRIAEDEENPNQLAGPIARPVVTDWVFGTENRLVFARLAEAVASGEIDPQREHFGTLLDAMGFDPTRSRIHDEEETFVRPEPSSLGPAGDRPSPGLFRAVVDRLLRRP